MASEVRGMGGELGAGDISSLIYNQLNLGF